MNINANNRIPFCSSGNVTFLPFPQPTSKCEFGFLFQTCYQISIRSTKNSSFVRKPYAVSSTEISNFCLTLGHFPKIFPKIASLYSSQFFSSAKYRLTNKSYSPARSLNSQTREQLPAESKQLRLPAPNIKRILRLRF